MEPRRKQVVALGGGGFSMEPDNPLLDLYVARLVGKEKPKICFLPTASGDSVSYAHGFHRAFKKLTKKSTSHLLLTPPSKPDVRAHLLAQDVIYVGGGNTHQMLSVWQSLGVDEALREAYEAGVILAGVSAGALCWFDAGLSDYIPGKLSPLPALGFLPGSFCPHYDGEPLRRPAFQKLVATGQLPRGYGVDDGAALHFVDGQLARVVSSRPDARAYELKAASGHVRETELVPDYLGGAGTLLIRRAAAGDAEGMLKAHHVSVREIASKDYTKEQIDAWAGRPLDDETLAGLESQIRTDFLWVIEQDGRIEGYVHLRTPMETAPAAYLHALYLTPAVAGKGLARRLMQLAEQEAGRRGYPSIELHASKTAIGFYAALGFRREGQPLLHNVKGQALPCFPMVKDLARLDDGAAGG